MNKLLHHLENTKEFMMLELQSTRKLTEQEKNYIKQITGINWELRDTYRNDACLIFTDDEDYGGFMERTAGCKDLFKVESEQLGLYCYMVNFIDCKPIFNLLGGGIYEK